MRKIAISLLLTFSLIWAQLAQAQLMVNALNGFNAGGEDPTYSVTYLGSLVWSSGSTVTGAIDIGGVHSKKEVFLACSVLGSSVTMTAASTTVGGTAVTKATTEASTSLAARSLGFVSLATMAGSQTITVTYSSTLSGGTCGVYKVLNRANRGSNQVSQAAANGTSASCTPSTAFAYTAASIIFYANFHASNATTSNSGSPTLTKDVDTLAASTTTILHSAIQGSSGTTSHATSWSTSVSSACLEWMFN